MLKKPAPEQMAIEMVTLDSLVPLGHLLRRIDAAIDFSFIHELTAPLYCAANGRSPLDPTLMFKALSSATCSASARNASWCARSRSMSPIAGFCG